MMYKQRQQEQEPTIAVCFIFVNKCLWLISLFFGCICDSRLWMGGGCTAGFHIGYTTDIVSHRIYAKWWQDLKFTFAFIPLSSCNNIIRVVSICGSSVHILIGENVQISCIVGCYPTWRRQTPMRTTMRRAMRQWEELCHANISSWVEPTFQLLLLAPLRKLMSDACDEVEQDVSGLGEVLLAVPWAFWLVSTFFWIDINLWKY